MLSAVRRVLKYDQIHLEQNVDAYTSLEEQKNLLQIALAQARFIPGTKIYIDLVLLALTLVNAALNNTRFSSVALEAATTALSIASVLHDFLPDIDNLTERDLKYLQALSSDIETIRCLLNEAHKTMIQMLNSSPPPQGINIAPWLKLFQRTHEAFLRKVSQFTIDPDLAARRAAREMRDAADAHILNWENIETSWKPGGHQRPRANFWEQAYEGAIQGKPVLVKTYPLASFEDFRNDLEVLKAHRHSNLPELFAHSTSRSAMPFIAVSVDSVIPLAAYISTLCKTVPDSAAEDVWMILMKIHQTSEYLLRRRICNEHGRLEDTLESCAVRQSGQVVLAPTFSRVSRDSFQRPVRQMDITETVASIYLGSVKENIDRASAVPTSFRPLDYALRHNPSAALHPSFPSLREICLTQPGKEVCQKSLRKFFRSSRNTGNASREVESGISITRLA